MNRDELDVLVDSAASIGIEGGVFGSRVTGGGFGGCTITLLHREAAADVTRHIKAPYRTITNREATGFATSAVDGARVLRGA